MYRTAYGAGPNSNMKVAIMGAGLAGLSCAIELERNGIQPSIFEKRSQVGDRFINGEVFISVFSRPVMDEVRFLSEKHGIYFRPRSNINELTIYSPNHKASLTGPIGFVSIRGRHSESLEKQLERHVHTNINFNSEKSYDDLLGEFTHVVLATGDAAYAKQIQPFKTGLTATVMGATVEGDFSRNKVVCWFDNRFAPHSGYGFLIPFSDKEASLALSYPEYEGTAYSENDLWMQFQNRASDDMKQALTVRDTFEVNQYIIGQSESVRIGNTFFTGNCFGTLMPLAGFGQFPSMLTGIYTAKDILGIGKYEELTAPIRKSYDNSLTLRHFAESLDNDSLDRVVQLLDGYWGQKLVHSRINFLKWVSYIARTWSAISPFD